MSEQKIPFNFEKLLFLNELIWGISREELLGEAERLGISLEVNIDRLYMCLTGIQHDLVRKALQIDRISYFVERYKPACLEIQTILKQRGYCCTYFIPEFDRKQLLCFLLSEDPAYTGETISIGSAFKLIHQAMCNLYYEVLHVPEDLYNYTVHTEEQISFQEIPETYHKLKFLHDSMFFFPKSMILDSNQFTERKKCPCTTSLATLAGWKLPLQAAICNTLMKSWKVASGITCIPFAAQA